MYPKQLKTILPLKLPLLLNKLTLLLLTQHTTILGQNLLILPHSLRRDTLVDELLDFLVDEQGVSGLLFLTRFNSGLDLVN